MVCVWVTVVARVGRMTTSVRAGVKARVEARAEIGSKLMIHVHNGNSLPDSCTAHLSPCISNPLSFLF